YDVTVAANTTSVIITATASDALASVAITNGGNIDVTSGSAAATITVTAQDGTAISYTVNITVETATSVSKSKEANIKVYPTVTTSVVTIEFIEKPGIIKVYSLSGQLIKTVRSTSSIETIDLTSDGIYLIEVQSNGLTRIVKVIKK
ncbi:T9SS type A sorting domain-containing protein, partial [Carboxylicivirga linearis]